MDHEEFAVWIQGLTLLQLAELLEAVSLELEDRRLEDLAGDVEEMSQRVEERYAGSRRTRRR